jgi:serine/threonine-protein kinase
MHVCRKCQHEAIAGAASCPACGASLGTSDEAEAADELTGRTLRGVYLVQERISTGVMGTVYKAVHTALDAPFAVKILKQDLQPDLGVVARFRQEARALSRLRHPNVVAVTDFGQTEDGTLFVVMEYVTGKSLERVIAEQAPLPEHRVVRIGAQILAGLAEAHARQVLHGALSPKDVMLESRRDPPDAVKVLDFGVASLHMAGAVPSAATRAGLELGNPAYMSPEQRVGGDLDARSDLYAVGVVLYEMLTGRLPFDPRTPAARQPEPLPPSAHLERPVSPELEALVLRALSPHRFERPESAADMRDELLRCAIAPAPAEESDPRECGPTVVLPRSPPPMTPPPETPRERPAPQTPLPPTARATERTTPRAGTRATPRATERTTPRAATRATPRATERSTPRATERSTPRATRAASSTTGRSGTLDRGVLQDVERRALPILGPVTPYLVAKAGAVAGTVEELCDIVASFIPSDVDRKAFLTATATATRTRASPPPRDRTRTAVVRWDPALLDRARRELALHIGPVARVVVQRASAAASSPAQLCELLAREIADDDDRAAFRRALSQGGGPEG